MLDKIHERVRSRVWNLYAAKDSDTIYDFVPRGPAACMEAGGQYMLLPQVPDPADVNQVTDAVSYIRQRCIFPFVRHKGRVLALALLCVDNEGITIRGLTEDHLTCDELYQDLANLPSISCTN